MAFQQFSVLARNTISNVISRQFSVCNPKLIQFSPCLCAEPLKKKKRIDPAVVKAREERRKKKMEKQIRRLERNQRQLKPIEEVEVPLELIDEKTRRARPGGISPERMEEIALLQKQWSRYKLQQHIADSLMLDRIVLSQQKALEQLRQESEELYQSAVKIDEDLLPIQINGPVDTPPIENYNSPDGEYLDISKKWV